MTLLPKAREQTGNALVLPVAIGHNRISQLGSRREVSVVSNPSLSATEFKKAR